ncbi:MAG: NTP transferase domain-containing protein [Balneolales bacterium]|nr:NTP transferase domain-containing protein [Balneolales bacterium]
MHYAVIMAGGVGSRFWPSSRKNKPKQFLNLIGERSMIQETVDRITPLIPSERILIITNDSYVDLVKEQLPDVPHENIIGEPVARNTAPCVAIAAAILQKRDPSATMVVLPADHYITKESKFREILLSGINVAEAGPNLITIGITPHRPETGYGYIQMNEEVAFDGSHPVHEVKTFAEKPDLKTAVSFLESGDFLWNSGMFIWKAKTILDQFYTHLPAIYREVEAFDAAADRDMSKAIETFYHGVMSISIDYGIMEKAETVFVVPGEFGWSDVGSWMAVYELGEKDEHGNVNDDSSVVFQKSVNCMVRMNSEKLVAMVGLHGIAVVETNDTLLICNLDEAQEVKSVVDQLEEQDLSRFK